VSRESTFVLDDIATCCSGIAEYAHGLSRDEALADQMRLDAVLMNLHVMGEAVKNLPEELRRQYPDVPWRRIAGMRDFLAHVDFAIDLGIVWDTITRDVPQLHARVREIIADLGDPRQGAD
jgi:uncharacterized protein with HEPN domain